MRHTEEAGELRRRLRADDRQALTDRYEDRARAPCDHALRLPGDWPTTGRRPRGIMSENRPDSSRHQHDR
ncbi:hypothetical protein [Streptomyces sp. NPDC059092]|uniref:hypothetical protein n=1 Tax=Streptomyces sp. NPDC059092 TaxID=3346725 RepID=UPI00369A3CA5